MGQDIDRLGGRAVYLQIADDLRQGILKGQLPAGAHMPTEPELIERYGASRGTVRNAIAVLRSEGLLDVEQGRGMFVRKRPPIQRLAYDRFSRQHRQEGKAAFIAELESEGRAPDVDVLEVSTQRASEEVAKLLGLRKGNRVLVRRRRYLADRQPVELATSYLPYQLVKGTAICKQDPGPGGIYARLEELGHRLKFFTENVSARMPLPDETRLLQLRPGVPVFRLVRIAFSEGDRPVEVCDTRMAADSYVLSYRLPAD